MPPQPPGSLRVYETVLYVDDLDRAEAFYAGVLGLERIGERSDLMRTFRIDRGSVLLLFDPDRASVGGRTVPEHGARGAGHVAFSIERGLRGAWLAHLCAHGVAIEREVRWSDGAHSVYVRDPAGNSVELVEGELWGVGG